MTVEVIGASRCDRCAARDGRRVRAGHWASRGYDALCDPCLSVCPRTELVRGWGIERGDALIGDDGSAVVVLDVWVDGDRLVIRYRCPAGPVLTVATLPALTQRRIIPPDYPLAGIPFTLDTR